MAPSGDLGVPMVCLFESDGSHGTIGRPQRSTVTRIAGRGVLVGPSVKVSRGVGSNGGGGDLFEYLVVVLWWYRHGDYFA